jgi:hypothetical protein
VNTFEGLPDVPQSRFELNVNGGPGGILFNFNELCETPSTADTTFTAHSGAIVTSRPPLEVEGCARQIVGASLASRTIKVTRAGIAKVRLRCPARVSRCRDRLAIERASGVSTAARRFGRSQPFFIHSNRKKTIRVRLSRRVVRTLKRRHRLRVMVVGKNGRDRAKATLRLARRR